MKSVYVVAASNLVLALALGAAPVGAEQTQGGMQTTQSKGSQAGQGMVSKRVDDLDDLDVVSAAGERIGELEEIVRDKQSGALYAVVSAGGFLGLGEKEVTIPLTDIAMAGDRLSARGATTEEELKAQPAYEEDRFDELSDDQTVEIASAHATGAAGATAMQRPGGDDVSFSALDSNSDGYLSKDEAESDAGLKDQWAAIDSNADGHIDKSEFSAFESQGSAKMPEGRSGKTQ